MTLADLAARCGMSPDEFRAHVAAEVATAPLLSPADAAVIRGLIPNPADLQRERK